MLIARSICVALKTLVYVPSCCVILKAHCNSKIDYYYTWARNGAGMFFAGFFFILLYNAVWRDKWGGGTPPHRAKLSCVIAQNGGWLCCVIFTPRLKKTKCNLEQPRLPWGNLLTPVNFILIPFEKQNNTDRIHKKKTNTINQVTPTPDL